MRKRIGVRFGALALLASVGVMIVPGCVIRIGPGTGDPTDGDSTGASGVGGAGSGSGDLGSGNQTPEEQGAEALAQITPQALALDEARTGFAAYDTMGLVATSVSDPSTLDEETLMQLLRQYAPTGYDDATKWLASIDPTTLSSPPVVPDFDKCVPPPYDCDGVVSCDFAKICVVTTCNVKGCGPCPDLFDLSKLYVKSWCGYTCVVGKNIVGSAIVFTSKFKSLSEKVCLPN